MFVKKYILCLCLCSLSFSQLIDNLDINAFKSLAIPGWGQMEISEEKRAKNFLILEACTWLSFLGSHYSNNWYTDNYMSFGTYHAGIDLNNINDNELSLIIVHLSQYDNIYDYNDTMERQRRYDDVYPDIPKYQWDWNSTKNRHSFNDLRVKASFTKKINNFTIAALIVNRALSFFDVAYLNGKNNYKIESAVLPISNNSVILNCRLHF
tara:strand:- start:153 stop:779 length:627 start_codon:yes stop_codon:yes gene_type:complete